MKPFTERTEKEINELKNIQCRHCVYYMGGNGEKLVSVGMCDYLNKTGHSRGCDPFECTEKGVFKPKKKARKSKTFAERLKALRGSSLL